MMILLDGVIALIMVGQGILLAASFELPLGASAAIIGSGFIGGLWGNDCIRGIMSHRTSRSQQE